MNCTVHLHAGRLRNLARHPGDARACSHRGGQAAGAAAGQGDGAQPASSAAGSGARLEPDMAVKAVRIAQQVDGPVKVVWTREEDIQHDIYRPVYYDRIAATLEGRKNRRLALSCHRFRPSWRAGCRRLSPATIASTSTRSTAPSTFHTRSPTCASNVVRDEPPAVPTGFLARRRPQQQCLCHRKLHRRAGAGRRARTRWNSAAPC